MNEQSMRDYTSAGGRGAEKEQVTYQLHTLIVEGGLREFGDGMRKGENDENDDGD